MKEESKVDREQQSHKIDYFALVTNISVVLILFSCIFVYWAVENQLNIADKVCKNINIAFEQTKLLLIAFFTCFWLTSIVYKNNKQSNLYRILDITGYTISVLGFPFYLAYLLVCP